MEKLAAMCCLWTFGLGSKEDYFDELDRLFLDNSESDFLLELEDLGGDCVAAWARLLRIFEREIGIDKFGAELLSALEKVYNENKFSLEELGKKCYNMWCELPRSLAFDYPFLSLCYTLDEPVFGETHAREWYQKVFDYYKG